MEGETTTETTLLAELDKRQNDVITELDRLNERILKTIDDWTQHSLQLVTE